MSLDFSALIAGVTIAQKDTVRQLLLYCSRVLTYCPAEGDVSQTTPAELADLALAYVPAPLGEAVSGFRGLLADIARHRADYHRGAFSALANRTGGRQVDQEEFWGLIRRLRTSSASAVEEDEALFKARLLLALAEIHDQEEGEIAAALAAVEDKGLVMLRRLTQGDDEEEVLAVPPGLSSAAIRPETGEALAGRMRAWASLFLADQMQDDHWLLAAGPDVWGLLADYASDALRQCPPAVFSLPLSHSKALAGLCPGAYRQARDAWQAVSQAPRQALGDGLLRLAAGDKADLAPAQAEMIELQQGHPLWAGATGRLDFYLLPQSIPALMARIARRPQSPSNKDRHPRPYGVVAVVTTV